MEKVQEILQKELARLESCQEFSAQEERWIIDGKIEGLEFAITTIEEVTKIEVKNGKHIG